MTENKIARQQRDAMLKENILAEVKQYHADFGKVLRENFCKQNKRSSSTIRRLFGSWNNLLVEAGIPINMNKNVTKEEVKEKMLELYEKHGKLTAEIQRNESGYSQIVIDNLFGSFGAMMDQIGLREEKAYQKFTDEELLDNLREIYEDYGYIDSKLIDQVAKATYQTYVSRFGTCAQAVQKAGLVYGYLDHGYSSKEARQVIELIAEILDEKPHIEFAFEWIRSRQGNNVMPVDAYFEKANVVIEYQGYYHYHVCSFLQKKKSLEEIQLDDARKKEAILAHGIRYIEFAYTEPKTFDYIFRKLKRELGIKVVVQ